MYKWISCYEKTCDKSLEDKNRVNTLTSTRLRKHLATISQILKMESTELEQLASFMGHTQKTHNEWYRLPSDIYQTAKISKVLLLAQKNGIDQYKNCSLSDICLDNDDILEDNNPVSDLDEIGNTEDTDNSLVVENTSNKETFLPKNKKPFKRVVIPWSKESKLITEEFFKEHIKKKIPPKKAEVLQLIEKYPALFINRKWDCIKVYVQNKYRH